MQKFKVFIQQFNWKIVLIRILVNAASLALTVMIIPEISFVTQNFQTVIISAIGLGILNAIVKPIILLLTGQFIFATFGLLVILVNALMLYLLEWLFPSILMVNSLLWALIGGAVLGLVSNALENLLGVAPPIVAEDELELRRRIEAKQQASLTSLVIEPTTIVQPDVETQSVSELMAAKAALDALQIKAEPDPNSLPGSENLPETAGPPEANQALPDAPETPGQEFLPDENTEPEPKEGAA